MIKVLAVGSRTGEYRPQPLGQEAALFGCRDEARWEVQILHEIVILSTVHKRMVIRTGALLQPDIDVRRGQGQGSLPTLDWIMMVRKKVFLPDLYPR